MVQIGQPAQLSAVERAPARRTRFAEHPPLREVMAQFATGVTVLTAAGERCHGMTANAFSSVSLEPPLVLCCVSRAARMHDAITGAGAFAVSILAAGQAELARHFANGERPQGPAQFEDIEWMPGPGTGAPLLSGCLAWMECELAETYQGGDHSIFLGRVVALGRCLDGAALLFFDGSFHEVGSTARAAS